MNREFADDNVIYIGGATRLGEFLPTKDSISIDEDNLWLQISSHGILETATDVHEAHGNEEEHS